MAACERQRLIGSGLSCQTLGPMEDIDYVHHVIDPWLEKYRKQGADALTPLEALAVGVWLLEAEVNSGGFNHYYFYSRGALAEQTVEALDAIGASETAGI